MRARTHDYSKPAVWKQDERWTRTMGKGVSRRIVAHTQAGMVVVIDLDPGSAVPPHSHPHAQYGLCAAGSGDLFVEGKKMDVSAGDGYYVPPGAKHEFRTSSARTRLVEFFTPVREDLLGDAPEPDSPQGSTK